MSELDLDVGTPAQVGDILRAAAERYREEQEALQAARRDENAGREWERLARILERAAAAVDRCLEGTT